MCFHMPVREASDIQSIGPSAFYILGSGEPGDRLSPIGFRSTGIGVAPFPRLDCETARLLDSVENAEGLSQAPGPSEQGSRLTRMWY